MARDRDGTWIEVTDPVVLAKVLNSGETFYRLHARNRNVRALKDIFDRVFWTPAQAVDLTVSGQVEVDLVSRLHWARVRLASSQWAVSRRPRAASRGPRLTPAQTRTLQRLVTAWVRRESTQIARRLGRALSARRAARDYFDHAWAQVYFFVQTLEGWTRLPDPTASWPCRD